MVLTIHDVAAKAGVSASTVSLVINQKPNVSPTTVLAVRTAMQDLGYVPKVPEKRRGPRLGNYNNKKMRRVCLLAYDLFGSVLYSPVYLSVLRGIDNALSKHGMHLQINHISPDMEQINIDFFSGAADGVIFLGSSPREAHLPLLLQFPCVQVMGDVTITQRWDHITYDNTMIGELAASYMQEEGHACCAVITQPDKALLRRAKDFQAAVKERGGQAAVFEDAELMNISADRHMVRRERMAAILDRILAMPQKPTGIFLTTDILAPTFYSLLAERNLKPGTDLQIISCNKEDILLNGLYPPPATIDIQSDNIGFRAVEQLLLRIAHPDQPQTRIALLPSIHRFSEQTD